MEASMENSASEQNDPEYAGFWIRVLAAIIDSVIIILVTAPILYAVYGADYFLVEAEVGSRGSIDTLVSYVFPAIAIILFWIYRSATPGKMMLGLKIIREDGGETLTPAQSIGRYFAYYLCMIPLFLGFIWVAFDARKQGWHDKLAGTLVIKS